MIVSDPESGWGVPDVETEAVDAWMAANADRPAPVGPRWPRIRVRGWTGCETCGEFEGRTIAFEWGRLRIEVAFGLFERRPHG